MRPGLVPAAALTGRLTAAGGDYRRASRILETAYEKTPHPDLAAAYLRMRPGDSAADRLTRARNLARLAPNDPESRLTIAPRRARGARFRRRARGDRAPARSRRGVRAARRVRVCLLMADLEETQGSPGAVREWLARAARAPRDRAWVADGFVSDRWAPVSPAGKLDAFVWRTPDERLSAPSEPLPASIPPPSLALIEEPAEAPAPVLASPPIEAPRLAAVESEPAAEPSPTGASPKIVPLETATSAPKAPDDPGARPENAKRGGFRLFS